MAKELGFDGLVSNLVYTGCSHADDNNISYGTQWELSLPVISYWRLCNGEAS